MAKKNKTVQYLQEGNLGVHSRLFAYVRWKAREDLKKAGTKNDVHGRIAEDKVKYSEPEPCTECLAKKRATRDVPGMKQEQRTRRLRVTSLNSLSNPM